MQCTELITKILNKKNKKMEKQIQNLNKIGEIAKNFHMNCRTFTDSVKNKIDLLISGEDCVIIEVSHQPNFMPYYGVWKKSVFAHYLVNFLEEKRIPAVALFGFVDQDTTMSPFLYRNKIPYYSKEGYKNIGFKIKGENEWWRLWCKQPLPPLKEVEKQIDFLITAYTNCGLSRDDEDLIQLEKLFRACYINSNSFSEANAKFFSKICNEMFDLDVIFFIYSEVQKSNIFTNSFEYLLSKRREYVDIYNKTIEQRGLELEKVQEDHVPFWYHCECGGKVRLKANEIGENIILKGTCPICKHGFEIEVGNDFDLSAIYKSISFEAVSRELIVPDVLGTDVYVEGLGGSLLFRQISDVIAERLRFNKPLTVRWKSHDKYVSVILHKIIFDFVRRYSISSLKYKLQDMDTNYRIIYEKIAELDIQQDTLKKELKRYKHQSNEFLTILERLRDINLRKKKLNAEIARLSSILLNIQRLSKAYNTIPSIIDEVVSVGFDNVLKHWMSDLKNNDFDIEHTIKLPVKTVKGVDYKAIVTFIDFIENYPAGGESDLNTI